MKPVAGRPRRDHGESEELMRKRQQAAAIVLLASAMLLGGCRNIDVIAVQSGLKENPYYQLGDTWWDHGGIEEYYFNQVPSSLNEI